jgi:hypothetical protein
VKTLSSTVTVTTTKIASMPTGSGSSSMTTGARMIEGEPARSEPADEGDSRRPQPEAEERDSDRQHPDHREAQDTVVAHRPRRGRQRIGRGDAEQAEQQARE